MTCRDGKLVEESPGLRPGFFEGKRGGGPVPTFSSIRRRCTRICINRFAIGLWRGRDEFFFCQSIGCCEMKKRITFAPK